MVRATSLTVSPFGVEQRMGLARCVVTAADGFSPCLLAYGFPAEITAHPSPAESWSVSPVSA